MKITDVHAHVFPDKLADKAAHSIGDFYGAASYCAASVENLLREEQKAGISRCVISNSAVTPHQVHDVNTFLASAAASHPSFVGFGSIYPGMDGFEVLREIREQENGEKHLPVMLLTARAEDADQVRGLEGGADDYVTKPFSPIVLAARVRTLLKREGRAASPLEIIGLLSVNELRREVLVEDQPVDLTPKEYELLIVPSDSFGVGGWVRLSYCIARDTIERSMPAFKALKESYEAKLSS